MKQKTELKKKILPLSRILINVAKKQLELTFNFVIG